MADKRNLHAVQRLSGLDTSFLYTESPTLHMHTLKIGIIDPPARSAATVRALQGGARGAAAPAAAVPAPRDPGPLRAAPSGVGRGRVVRSRAARDADARGRAGIERELDAAISEIASTPLPRDRPLWEITVVEGLEDGRVGFVAKLHHAVADGVAAAQLLANVMELAPETDRGRGHRPSRGGASPCQARPTSRSDRSATSSRCSYASRRCSFARCDGSAT